MAASKPMLINEEKTFIESEIELISLDLQEINKLKNSTTKTFDNKTSISILDKTPQKGLFRNPRCLLFCHLGTT